MIFSLHQIWFSVVTVDEIVQDVQNPDMWRKWSVQIGRALLVLLIAWILTRLVRWSIVRLRRLIIRRIDRRHEGPTLDMEKRARTLISVCSKAVDSLIWITAVLIALRELSYRVEPFLAGLGIAGIALGLGAQTLVKDWLAGLFLLIEDQVRIGDLVVINNMTGTVEEIDLRTILLRGEDGAVHIIANGAITTLSNLTREYAYYVFETTLAHGADTDEAFEIIKLVGGEIQNDDEYRSMILSKIEVMGVECLADRGVMVKARIKTLPSRRLHVGRELNRRVSIRLKEKGIAFPQFPNLPPLQP